MLPGLAGGMWVVRHAESTWNALEPVQGHAPGPVLTRRGQHQARAAARLLKEAATGATGVVTSDLDRAHETAVPIARVLGLPLRVDPRLRERSLGAAEDRPFALLGPEWSGVRDRRVVDPDAAPPGGEPVAAFYHRVVACLEELAAGGEQVVVTHGGVVRVFLAWAAEVGPGSMAWRPVPNGWVAWRPAPGATHGVAVPARPLAVLR